MEAQREILIKIIVSTFIILLISALFTIIENCSCIIQLKNLSIISDLIITMIQIEGILLVALITALVLRINYFDNALNNQVLEINKLFRKYGYNFISLFHTQIENDYKKFVEQVNKNERYPEKIKDSDLKRGDLLINTSYKNLFELRNYDLWLSLYPVGYIFSLIIICLFSLLFIDIIKGTLVATFILVAVLLSVIWSIFLIYTFARYLFKNPFDKIGKE